VLNTLNTRLDAHAAGLQLTTARPGADHRPRIRRHHAPALDILRQLRPQPVLVIDVDDSEYTGAGSARQHEYEPCSPRDDPPLAAWRLPADEWDAIASTTPRAPPATPRAWSPPPRRLPQRGVQRGRPGPCRTSPVYLWTLPMFHCNGWCFPWTVAMLAGTHVCLRKVEARAILDAIREHGSPLLRRADRAQAC
jgi:fatty-acyl-CoA synthase